MEACENAVIETRLNGIARATIRRGVQIGHWRANAEHKGIIHTFLGGVLQRVADNSALRLPLGPAGVDHIQVRNAQIKVTRGASALPKP